MKQTAIILISIPVINLGGYTKGARNDVLAARPCPVQIQLMGYAGTLGAGYISFLLIVLGNAAE
jgi:predicted O-linked N-acetylglucosamine transferase (SPINDLY family)